MYHAIVRRRIVALFDAINRGDAGPVLAGFAPGAEHAMISTHALSGRRVSPRAIADWYARLFRLLPDIRFDLRRIEVSGPPWATIATVEWRETNSATDGVRTTATGMHGVHIAWGRMTRLVILTDTAKLEATLRRIAAKGTAEALAAPIADGPDRP